MMAACCAADGAGSGPRQGGDRETRGADVSEAEFASEAQKAQEQTQVDYSKLRNIT